MLIMQMYTAGEPTCGLNLCMQADEDGTCPLQWVLTCARELSMDEGFRTLRQELIN